MKMPGSILVKQVGLWLLLLTRQATSQSAVINIEPATFLPAVTPSVAIRCSLSHKDADPSPQILIMQIYRRELVEKKERKGNKNDAEDDVLMVTATPGQSGATLNVDNEDGRLTVEGSITATGTDPPMVTLHVGSPMEEQDQGRFVCKVSVLDNNFRMQILTADATLSIIDQEGSAVLLLAKEQILEEEQKKLEKQEQNLQKDLQETQDENSQLTQSLGQLQKSVDVLTARLDAMDGDVKAMSEKLEGAELEASLRSEFMSPKDGDASQSQLDDVKERLDRLEKDITKNLQKKIDLLESDTLKDMTSRLESLEQNVPDTDVKTKSTYSGKGKPDKDTQEALRTMGTRIDAIFNDAIKPLQNKVEHLENDNLKKLSNRVQRVEEELPRLRDNVGSLQMALANLTNSANQPAPRTQSTTAAVSRKCHVCGDPKSEQPCTVDELRKNQVRVCPKDQQFCMNDIIQEGNSRNIYKRCVDEKTCRDWHNARDPDCAHFNFMSYGSFQCHYCCTQDLCNSEFKPLQHLIDQ